MKWSGSLPSPCRVSAAEDLVRPVDVVVDVEVEVDADPLEEVVVERDEADFDGDLQVLQPPQLLQQVGDFLVDFLRLADDQAEVGLEGGDRARPADLVPGGGLDGRGDQIDQAVEVGLRSAAQSARARARSATCLAPPAIRALPGSRHLGQHGWG